MERWLVINALKMALQSRYPPKGLLHHSDRGSQYASNDYQQVLTDNNICCSMSRKRNGPKMHDLIGRSVMIML
jgi:putative transposase